jgi:hypothetical protein
MWPFRASLEAWFDRAMDRVDRAMAAAPRTPDP